MKIPNKPEVHLITSNYLSDIDFRDFMNLYKKCTAKSYPFLVIDATLALTNPLHFRKTIEVKIRDEKYNMILTEKEQKHQHYHQEKLINVNILQVKKYYLLIKEQL